MDKVFSYQEVLDTIKEIKDIKKGFITNFFPDTIKVNEWINAGDFYVSRIKDSLFLFRKNKEFVNLFFCSSSLDMLNQSLSELNLETKDVHIVVDLLGKNDDVTKLSEVLKSNSFHEYVTLGRMSKSTEDEIATLLNVNLKTAKVEQAEIILNLLLTYFDPIAEQLPCYDEIINWIKLNHIIIYESNEKVIGFLIYDLIGLTSYLRYWFVHPEHRNEKIGSVLLKDFFRYSKGTKRQLFWVIQSNDNAIKRYKHYGFEPENLCDTVMTNKNIHYETKGN